MKKLALALVASTVALSAANANISTGFYLGATAGYGATSGKYTGAGINAAGAQQAVAGSTDIGGNAANIGIIGGYGWVTGCAYYGAEIGYSFENTKVRDTLFATNATGSTELKRNGYFNAALRGGYLFTPNTMFYVRLGANWGKWTLNDSLRFGFSNVNPATGSKNRMSFTPGLGLETAIHKNVYLRVEYTYEFGPSVRAKANNNNTGFSNVGSIRSQSGKIGLAYKF
jgi:opacity protein-like surface antigen